MAQKDPMYSIISVVYNDADNLEKTIRSILNQSFSDFEYIVIDGGSTDRTTEIIKRYEAHITYWVSEPDNGIYDAMNKGIKSAKGKYINFLNAGDTYYNSAALMEVAHQITKQQNIEVFYGQAVRHSSESSKLKFVKGGKINSYNLFTTIPFCHQAILYKTELFKEIGLYDTNFRITADYQWLIRYYNIRGSLTKTIFMNILLVEYLEGGYSFVNIQKAAKEKLSIAIHYFNFSKKIIGLPFFSAYYVKAILIKWLVKFNFLEGYRSIKYRILNKAVS